MARSYRFTVAGLMGVVLVASLAMAALRSNSVVWAGAMFLTTCAVLALAVVGAACRSGAERAWWLGFALFGWGYVALMLWGSNLATVALFDALRPYFGIPLNFKFGLDAYAQVAHCLCSLLAAAVGGLLARILLGVPVTSQVANNGGPRPEPQVPRKWWRRPAILGIAGIVAASGVALLGLKWVAGPLAAVGMLATWGLLGLAIVGAVCNRGKRRAAWLGAALFGVGYMYLILSDDQDEVPNWPHVATDRILNSVRSWLPDLVRETPTLSDPDAQANLRILKALDQPISLRFFNGTPLEDFLKAVKAAMQGPDGRNIPIHVDPIGLQQAERTLNSPLSIDLEGIPLRTSLRLALKQLDLFFSVRDGYLWIGAFGSGSDTDESFHIYRDPFLVVGQCLLTLLAALLGSVLAPLVAASRSESA